MSLFLHQICRNVSQQWMLCSEWVPSEWESDKNITIIHTTPVHQLLEEALLWILDVLMMDLFQLLSSRDVNWWTGGVWITCVLLWCFNQLFGLLAIKPWMVWHLSIWVSSYHTIGLHVCCDLENSGHLIMTIKINSGQEIVFLFNAQTLEQCP